MLVQIQTKQIRGKSEQLTLYIVEKYNITFFLIQFLCFKLYLQYIYIINKNGKDTNSCNGQQPTHEGVIAKTKEFLDFLVELLK